MASTVNRAKANLRGGGFAFGTWLKHTRNPASVRLAAEAGFDFVYIDTELSSMSWETLGDMCEMGRACGVAPVIRLYDGNRSTAARALNIGAMGLLFHDVEKRQDVEEIIDWVYGSKHIGRTAGDRSETIANTLVAIQIESRVGAENAAAILEGGGIDVVEIGRGDLSTDMGHPLERDHPEVMAAVESIASACRAAEVASAVTCVTFDDAEVERYMTLGARMFSHATDGRILERGYRTGIERFQRLTGVHAAEIAA